MRCKSSVVNCLVRTTSIFGTCEGNNSGGARLEKRRLLYGLCRSGRGDLGGEHTRRPERIRPYRTDGAITPHLPYLIERQYPYTLSCPAVGSVMPWGDFPL